MAFTISSGAALKFKLTKTGGAKMTVRIAVFKDPLTPQQQRVHLLFMGNQPNKTETQTLAALAPGNYQVVAVNIIEEAVSGTYDYVASLNTHVFAQRAGDVNTTTGLDVEPVIHRENLTVT